MKTGTASSRATTPRPRSTPTHQIIVAHRLTNNATDQAPCCRCSMRSRPTLGREPHEVSADSRLLPRGQLGRLASARHPRLRRHRPGRQATPTAARTNGRAAGRQPWRARLRRAGHRSRYRLRKQTVEPVFGQIKQARGFRQFLLRGIEKVKAEWALVCTAHNLTKLARAASA